MIFRKRRKTGVDMAIPILSALENYLKTLPRYGEYVFPVHAEMYLHDASSDFQRNIRSAGKSFYPKIPPAQNG